VLIRCSEDANELLNLAAAANSQQESPVSVAYDIVSSSLHCNLLGSIVLIGLCSSVAN